MANRNFKKIWYPTLHFGIQLLKIWYPGAKYTWQPWFQSPGLNITVDLSIVVSKKICFQLASQSDSHRFSCQLVESHPQSSSAASNDSTCPDCHTVSIFCCIPTLATISRTAAYIGVQKDYACFQIDVKVSQ